MRGVFVFCLKFFAIILPLLALWWWKLLPPYIEALGQLAGGLINALAGSPIQSMEVETNPDGVLTTDTILIYYINDRPGSIEIAKMANSLPPYIGLVLATAGIRILRKLVILAAGSLLIFGGHVAWVVTTYLFRVRFAESPEFPTALGQFWMTVPFILWIALAYWDKIKGYFAASRG